MPSIVGGPCNQVGVSTSNGTWNLLVEYRSMTVLADATVPEVLTFAVLTVACAAADVEVTAVVPLLHEPTSNVVAHTRASCLQAAGLLVPVRRLRPTRSSL